MVASCGVELQDVLAMCHVEVILRDVVSTIARSNYITHWTVLLPTLIAMPNGRQDNRCKRTRQEQSTEQCNRKRPQSFVNVSLATFLGVIAKRCACRGMGNA
jgi:hypothetical protein